jgi:hypothetical protein
MLGLSLILYGLVIRATAILPSRAGWLALAAGTVVIISSAPSRGTPPFLIYLLATLPLGVVPVLSRPAARQEEITRRTGSAKMGDNQVLEGPYNVWLIQSHKQ